MPVPGFLDLRVTHADTRRRGICVYVEVVISTMSTGEQDLALVVPPLLQRGVPMLKISSKKIKQVIIRLEDGAIHWASRKGTKGKSLCNSSTT
jgi:hypothetical protein